MIIYLAQLCHQKGNQYQNKCFPLAIGYIGAYLEQKFDKQITLDLFKSPNNFNDALESKRPDVVMLSSYMWNENLTCEFANKIKKKYPQTLVVLGGPNISLDREKRASFLKENKGIDLMVTGDGEFVAEEIIDFHIKNKDISLAKQNEFPFTCSIYNNNYIEGPEDGEYRLGMAKDKTSMEEFPSPYLSGLFDKFFIDGESPLLETNRGCPFTCTYCQQGGKYFQKVRQFPPGRFKKEIFYVANKIKELGVDITMIEMTDPNFGMFKRDKEICIAIRECQDKFNFPHFVGCSTGKNRADTIIDNISVLKEGTIFLRSSMQSLNKEALKSVKRQNIKLEAYVDIQKDMEKKNLESNADMMLGFPSETEETHSEAILKLIDTGTKEFAQYQTIILKGTEFEKKEYLLEHKIETKHRPIPECFRSYNIMGKESHVIETEEIIISTASMNFQEYLNCRKLHLIVMIFHNSRMLDIIYDFVSFRGKNKSDVIRNILASKNKKFKKLIDSYIKETTNELFTSKKDVLKVKDLESYTHNKIFRHMALAMFKNKDVVIEVLKESLYEITDGKDKKAIASLCEITADRIINPSRKLKTREIKITDEVLLECIGEKIVLSPTEHQRSSIEMLNKIYVDSEDVINKMIYYLRPKNTIIQARYTNEQNQSNS